MRIPADFEVFRIDVGDNVYCDMCSKDFTNLPDKGGFLFQSKGVCPDCSDRVMKSIKKYNEESFIRGECPEDVSFADWIRSIR